MSTLRLNFPQWQGGINKNYVFGAELLAAIAPKNEEQEEASVQVSVDFQMQNVKMDGIDYGKTLLKQMHQAEKILLEKDPAKVIVFGGDCGVTQVPFAFLRKKYGEEIGLIWFDAHPDCATIKTSSHFHEMVMGNLLGFNPDSELTRVERPFKKEHVLLAGLIEEELREMDMACIQNNITIFSPETLQSECNKIQKWLEANHLKYVAIHWDLDVLNPEDFRSIYPAEPYTDWNDFPAAVGRMTLKDMEKAFSEIEKCVDIVGLSITEHLPWDGIRLRETLKKMTIF